MSNDEWIYDPVQACSTEGFVPGFPHAFAVNDPLQWFEIPRTWSPFEHEVDLTNEFSVHGDETTPVLIPWGLFDSWDPGCDPPNVSVFATGPAPFASAMPRGVWVGGSAGQSEPIYAKLVGGNIVTGSPGVYTPDERPNRIRLAPYHRLLGYIAAAPPNFSSATLSVTGLSDPRQFSLARIICWVRRRSRNPPEFYGPPFVVGAMSGWYDGDSVGGADGALVPSWGDSSGYANALTAAGGRRPTLKRNLLNGHFGVSHATGQAMGSATGAVRGTAFSGNWSHTLVCVVIPRALSGVNDYWSFICYGSNGSGAQAGKSTSIIGQNNGRFWYGGQAEGGLYGSAVVVGQPVVLVKRFDMFKGTTSTFGTVDGYLNGTLDATAVPITYALGGTRVDTSFLENTGSNNPPTGNAFDLLYNVVYPRALGDDEIALDVASLRARFGI